jgi:hypothetical protein
MELAQKLMGLPKKDRTECIKLLAENADRDLKTKLMTGVTQSKLNV